MFDFKHLDWSSIEPEMLNPQIQRQFINTEKTTIARFVLSKGVVVPTHQHPNEQIAFVVSGALKFTIHEKETIVRTGQVLCIPSNVPHSAEALEDTVDIDVFTPPRADWMAKEDAYLR